MLLNPYRFGAPVSVSLTGLVAYWKLDETSGDAIDAHGAMTLFSSGVGSTATGLINGARTFFTNSLQFSGGSGPKLSTGDIDFTWSLWVKANALGNLSIINKWTDGQEFYIYTATTPYYFSFLVTGPGGNKVVYWPTPPTIGVWYHILAWHDSVADQIAISINNGTPATVAISGGLTALPTAPFYIGRFECFNGTIDEVGFWKRLLSPAERASLYNGGAGLAYPFGETPTVVPLLVKLVSYWKMDEVSGVAFDSHGPNTLTDNNTVTSAAGKIGNARDFEKDSTEYFSRPSNSTLQLGDIEFTFTAWIRMESLASPLMLIIGKDSLNGTTRELLLFYEPGANRITAAVAPLGTDASSLNLVGNALGAPSIGVWYFIVMWHDPVANKMYMQINNGGIDETAISGGAFVGNAVFNIGAAGAGSYTFDGLIDEVGFWKRVLTPSERAQLYNNSGGRTYPFDGPDYVPSPLLANLVSYWKLDEATGNAVDAHGTNHLPAPANPGSAAGKIGTARDFTAGAGSRFEIASNSTLQTGDVEFTFTAWINYKSAGAGMDVSVIIGKDNNAASREYWIYSNLPIGASARISAAIFPAGTTASGVSVVGNALGAPVIGVWYFVVFWHDPVANKIYLQINNGGIDEAAVSGGAFVGTAMFKIGMREASYSFFDGRIDEVGFWKRILTPAERTQLYNSGNGKTYPFT